MLPAGLQTDKPWATVNVFCTQEITLNPSCLNVSGAATFTTYPTRRPISGANFGNTFSFIVNWSNATFPNIGQVVLDLENAR